MAPRRARFALCALLVAGCGRQSAPQATFTVAQAPRADAAPAPAAPAPAQPPADALAERKVIFSGTLDVEVRDYAAAYRDLAALMKKHAAYFAKTEVRGDSGSRRAGAFTIKVPVGEFQPFVEAVAALGNPVRNTTDSQDVTEEFVDVAARVKNFKAEEEVLNRLPKDAGARLDDVFRIREQIRQNREQIERAEGRLNALAQKTQGVALG